MKNMGKLLLICALGFFLAGCQNPWKDFYQPSTDLPEEAPYAGSPNCVPSSDIGADVKEYFRNDFVLVGYTSFNAGGNVSLQQLQAFGEELKSDVVLYYIGNRTQSQSSMVVPHYNPGTQQTTYVNGYGSNGASFYGTANSYSSGTYSTSVVPVTVIRQDYAAAFFKKNWLKRILGLWVRPLAPSEATVVGTNSAGYVDIVVRGTPGFHADFFEGDVILEADGRPPSEFFPSIERWAGKEVKFVVLRKGSRITKLVRLGTGK